MAGLFAPGFVLPLPGAVTNEFAKRAVRDRSGGMCERCRIAQAREFHHRTYEHHGHERADELEHLCANCHRNVHFDANGVFWIDEDAKLANQEQERSTD